MEVELIDSGYLRIPAHIASQYFPARVLIASYKAPILYLLPLRGPEAGGLILKQRTLQGDCSVLIWEALPPGTPPGCYPVMWDATQGALHVYLEKKIERVSEQ